ncbi:ATP phosphoribosyltransferase regulatory subunit [Devosia pacifica]|uniref:ATP phosphoribosyltransferase regulatory subunit n=1 Tax=Devosia pacifica TaxID=1335967 RepID=A0A918SAH4_9HYPH|nr:ATP phosphoribosyltransferase regulatory subunit [Devosia pacifica]GHA31143.1 ATP phosphoribosyltransferase regulatory subunit [Devosia pacifica]
MSADARKQAFEDLLTAQAASRINPPLLLPADPYFDLAGEEFGRRLLLTTGSDGAEYCLRPEFTLPIVADYIRNGTREPASFAYHGPIFRQRPDGPAEFTQAGLELLAQRDADLALDRVLAFARDALTVYEVAAPRIRLGSVALFESLLAQLEMPDAWRPRIRHRFGHDEAMDRLLTRLEAAPDVPRAEQPHRDALIEDITEQMVAAGLSLTESRTPSEIADRYLEQQALDAAHVSPQTLALLRRILAISAPALEALSLVEAIAHSEGLDLRAPVASLKRHIDALPPEIEIVFEAGFSPRLDYYTGIVFEIQSAEGQVLASGGQYDRLLERLGATAPIAASGCALWIDRLEAEAAR